MNSILDWAISFLGESTQGTIRAIYFEGKTVKQHSEEEFVTVYAIYKRLARSYPVSHQGGRPRGAGGTRRRDVGRTRYGFKGSFLYVNLCLTEL